MGDASLPGQTLGKLILYRREVACVSREGRGTAKNQKVFSKQKPRIFTLRSNFSIQFWFERLLLSFILLGGALVLLCVFAHFALRPTSEPSSCVVVCPHWIIQ